MKRKLLATYILILITMLIPSSLMKPAHEGSLQTKQVPILEQLKPVEVHAFESLEKVPVSVEDIAYVLATQRGWNGSEWDALKKLWGNESGWNTDALNPSSGACGIPQAWPCSKIGDNWRDPKTQLTWGANYIADRYGSPSKALSFWYAQCGSSKGCWY